MRSSAINILSALKDAIISSNGIRTRRIWRGVRSNGCRDDSVNIGGTGTAAKDAIRDVARGEEASQQSISCIGRRGSQDVVSRRTVVGI